MTNKQVIKKYDLEDRTYEYARTVIKFCKQLPKNTINFPLMDQVIRSSGSVGANYIEANEVRFRRQNTAVC